MNIKQIKINYQDYCINVDNNSLVINWIIDINQTDYQVIIEGEDSRIYDSKKINSNDNIIYIKDLDLKSETKYMVKIKVWNNSNFCEKYQEFRTSIFGKFQGKWISNGDVLANEVDYYKDNRNYCLRKEFSLDNVMDEAFLYIVGLGYYNVYINEKKVGKAELNTDWTNYSKKIYYDTYEVSKYLRSGKNEILVELGNGWYNPSPLKLFGKYNLREVLDIGEPKLIADLKVKTTDNNYVVISTDESWEVTKGAYLFNNIYLGEKIDFRLLNEKFNLVDKELENARLTMPPAGNLEASFIEKNEATKIIEAKKIVVNENGDILIDFGETVEGFVDISMKGIEGQEVILVYGENLNEDESINVDSTVAGSVRKVYNVHQIDGGPGAPKTAAQKDICILGNHEVRYVNKFTYHSFRYVQISGIEKEDIKEIKAIYVHTNLKEAASFNCSDDFLNNLYEVAKVTKLNNIHSVFEDCAREHLGYGGDIVCLATSQIFMFHTERLYEKVIKDFRYDMRANGGLPETAPYMGIKSNGTGDGAGPLGWQLVYAYLINKLYQYYGNVRIVESEYKYVKKQVEYLMELGVEKLSKCCLGDWGSSEAKESNYQKISPDLEFTSSCFYLYHIELLAKFAKIIGNKEDNIKYKDIALEVKKYIVKKYKNEDGSYSERSQTSYAFALFFDLDDNPQKLADEFANKIVKNDYYITCGIFGMFMTYEVLNKYDYQNIIYKWLHNQNESSFYNMLKDGQSTLSEHVHIRGDEGSDNHAMYSSYTQWFFEALGGINISEESFGSDKVFIKPYFEEKIDFIECEYDSIKGNIRSNWYRKEGSILLQIQIPNNLKECLLVLDKKYKDSLQGYNIEKQDDKYIYINISDFNNVNELELIEV